MHVTALVAENDSQTSLDKFVFFGDNSNDSYGICAVQKSYFRDVQRQIRGNVGREVSALEDRAAFFVPLTFQVDIYIDGDVDRLAVHHRMRASDSSLRFTVTNF